MVGGQQHDPAALYPGKKPGGWVGPGPFWTGGEISLPPEFDPRNVQPVVSRYSDWAIPAHIVPWSEI